MKNIELTGQFKRDAKKQYLELLTPAWAEVMHCLSSGLTLPTKYRDHALTGNLKGIRNCHIKPDLITALPPGSRKRNPDTPWQSQ